MQFRIQVVEELISPKWNSCIAFTIMWKPCIFCSQECGSRKTTHTQKKKKSGKTLTSGVDMSTEDSVTRTERFIISTTLGGGQCDKNRFKETPGSNWLSSFTAFWGSRAGGGNNYQKKDLAFDYTDVCVHVCVFLCTLLHTHPLLHWSVFTGNVRESSRLAAWCRVTWRL